MGLVISFILGGVMGWFIASLMIAGKDDRD